MGMNKGYEQMKTGSFNIKNKSIKGEMRTR